MYVVCSAAQCESNRADFYETLARSFVPNFIKIQQRFPPILGHTKHTENNRCNVHVNVTLRVFSAIIVAAEKQ
jgi:hypothetical protein